MENEKKTGDKYSKLAGNTLIFAISSFSSKLLTLIVQPFLTYAMAEISDLGLSKILSQYANLLIPFVSMGMSNAIIRFGLDRGNSEKQVFTRPADHSGRLWHSGAVLAGYPVFAGYGAVWSADLHLCAHELPAHELGA